MSSSIYVCRLLAGKGHATQKKEVAIRIIMNKKYENQTSCVMKITRIWLLSINFEFICMFIIFGNTSSPSIIKIFFSMWYFFFCIWKFCWIYRTTLDLILGTPFLWSSFLNLFFLINFELKKGFEILKMNNFRKKL